MRRDAIGARGGNEWASATGIEARWCGREDIADESGNDGRERLAASRLPIVEILGDVRVEVFERRAEDPEVTVLVVATDLRIGGVETTPVSRGEIVLRVDTVDSRGLVEMFIRPETLVDHDSFAEFLGGHAVDCVSARFVFVDRAAGHELLAFRGVVLALSEEDAAVVFDHEVDRYERDVRDDRAPVIVGDRFFRVRHWCRPEDPVTT